MGRAGRNQEPPPLKKAGGSQEAAALGKWGPWGKAALIKPPQKIVVPERIGCAVAQQQQAQQPVVAVPFSRAVTPPLGFQGVAAAHKGAALNLLAQLRQQQQLLPAPAAHSNKAGLGILQHQEGDMGEEEEDGELMRLLLPTPCT